jgi:aminoglycoside phosphotransferase (APT) family kinase protein
VLSPFHGEPEDIRLRQARELSLDAAVGQWRLTETAFETMRRLHERGLVHGDAVLQNFIVCPSPLEVLPIDFEASRRRDELDEVSWQRSVQSDLDPLLLHAVFLLCTLGVQPGALAEAALARMGRLLRSPERFRREIERRSELEG